MISPVYPRAMLAASLIAALILTAACDTGGTGGKSAAASGPGASASPSVAAYAIAPTVADLVVEAEAGRTFGKTAANRAYQVTVRNVRLDSFNLARMRPKPKYTAADFDSVLGHMTPSLQEYFHKRLRKALAGDKDANDEVRMFALYDLTGYTFADQGPYV